MKSLKMFLKLLIIFSFFLMNIIFIPVTANATAPHAYIANSYDSTVSVIDTATDTVIATVGVGLHPNSLAINPSGTRVYVSNASGNSVSVIDTSTNTVITTIGVGNVPCQPAVNPSGTRVYVPNQNDDNVSVIDTSTNTVIATVAVGDGPIRLAVNPSGTRVYVSNHWSHTVSVIDTATNTVIATAGVGSYPTGVAVNPSGTMVYVANEGCCMPTYGTTISIIDTSTNAVVGAIGGFIGWFGHYIAVDLSGERLYVNGYYENVVYVVNTATNSIICKIPIQGPYAVAITPDGSKLYVSPYDNNLVSVVDTSTDLVVSTILVGYRPLCISIGTVPASNQTPVAACQNVIMPADSSCAADTSIDNGSYDPDGDPITLMQSPAGPYGLGDTSVTLTVSDDKGASNQCTGTVTVTDNSAPTISGVSVSPAVLWPPNNKMKAVTVNYSVADNCGAPTCAISSVTSNEPISNSDYTILDAHHVNLIAQRSGSGSGRIYTVGITCLDSSGNSSTEFATVAVPHDQGQK